MNLNEYIEILKKLQKKGYGNLQLIQAEDDEGNGYQQVSGTPCLVYIEKDSGYFIESVWEEIDEEDEEYFEQVVLIN